MAIRSLQAAIQRADELAVISQKSLNNHYTIYTNNTSNTIDSNIDLKNLNYTSILTQARAKVFRQVAYHPTLKLALDWGMYPGTVVRLIEEKGEDVVKRCIDRVQSRHEATFRPGQDINRQRGAMLHAMIRAA